MIGWLSPYSRAADSRTLDLIRSGLGDHGYAEGRNVVIEYRWAEERRAAHHTLPSAVLTYFCAVPKTGGVGPLAAEPPKFPEG